MLKKARTHSNNCGIRLIQLVIVSGLLLSFSVPVDYAAKYSSGPILSGGPHASSKGRSHSTTRDVDPMVEEFSFWIKDFKMDHQSEINVLQISVHYLYQANLADSAYPDFRLIASDIEAYMNTYRNKVDYWEIINKRLTTMLLKKYQEITRITVEIQVSPSALDHYLRSTRVTRQRTKSGKILYK